jgi:hypothetical protein
MLEELEPLCRGRVHLVVEDVDTRPEWQKTHGDNVPVLVADGQEVCRYRLDRGAVLELIRDTDQDT